MRNFLARCSTLGLLAGGFMLTGDAAWLVSRGQSLINATTVPTPPADEVAAAPVWSAPAHAAAAPVHAASAPAHAASASAYAAAAPFQALPAPPPPAEPAPTRALEPSAPPPAVATPVDVVVSPSLAAPVSQPPADGGLNALDLRLLRAGDRLVMWVAGGPLTFDLVDPATGEAIQQPAPRRVRISGVHDATRLVRGGMVVVRPLAGISGHEPAPERIGPIQAIAVK